jgi:peroxiredoxin
MLAEGDGAPVGLEGRVARVFPKVSPKAHDEVVLKALAELAAT